MGYDMNLVKEPDGGGSDGYYRLNIWGMARARELMGQRGMLCDAPEPSQAEWPECPDWDAYEWVQYPDCREDGAQPPDPAVLGAVEVYIAESARLLARHNGECPGIPVHKLGSNDGWIVTPPECIAALAALELAREKSVADPEESWWADWVAYLRLAVEHDGFEVH